MKKHITSQHKKQQQSDFSIYELVLRDGGPNKYCEQPHRWIKLYDKDGTWLCSHLVKINETKKETNIG